MTTYPLPDGLITIDVDGDTEMTVTVTQRGGDPVAVRLSPADALAVGGRILSWANGVRIRKAFGGVAEALADLGRQWADALKERTP